MNPKSTTKGKTLAKAIQTACDLHQRTLALYAAFAVFDPYGAALNDLSCAEARAFEIREYLIIYNPDFDLTALKPPRISPVKEGKDQYATFRNHVKGIKAAISRFKAIDYQAIRKIEIVLPLSLMESDLEEFKSKIA